MDWDAEFYRDHSHIQYAIAQDPLKEYSFLGHENLLDVGCGDGKITAELAHKVPKGQIVGMDLSPSMIALAQKTFTQPNLSFQVGNAEEIPWTAQFDFISCLCCLHWIKHPERALEGMVRALKPGGKILVVTFPEESPFRKYLEETKNEEPWKSYAEPSLWRSLSDYQSMVAQLPLKSFHFKVSQHLATYENWDGLKDYVRGWLNSYISLPKTLQEPFLDRSISKARHYNVEKEDGKIHLPYTLLTMTLTK